jgi:hypothetical protein
VYLRKVVVCRNGILFFLIFPLCLVVEGMQSSTCNVDSDGALLRGPSVMRAVESTGGGAGEGTDEDLNGLRGTSEDSGDYHILWLFETDNDAETSSGTCQDFTTVQRRCSNYESLSKSSKRRVRRGVKKEEMRDQPKVSTSTLLGQNQKFDHFHDKFMDQRMSQERFQEWRKRRIARKSNPFSTCYGMLAHFDCRHVFKALCRDCHISWEQSTPRTCSIREIYGLPQFRGIYGLPQFCFKQQCPSCLAKIQPHYIRGDGAKVNDKTTA